IEYPDYTGNNVSYTYGAPGATFNRADRIVTVTDASGSEERFYGPLGETIKTIKYVASKTEGNAANSPEIYVTEYTYDTFNRLRQLIYPDSEVLTYAYNSGGLAQSASGTKGDYDYPYLKALTYDKFEQRVFMRQGNGAETDYAYNPLNRRLATLKGKSGGRTFMDLAYGYDLVGNILNLDNLAKVNKPNEFGGETRYTYKYDDLYRLTDSTGSLKQKPNTEHQYTLAMRYDDIHNIMSKNQRHIRITPGGSSVEQKKTSYDFSYGYGSSRPHAPTQIGERAFSYDANGNQTGWESEKNGTRRAIVWDEENRIRTIRDNGHTLAYTYNDAGERVFKTGPQGETVYVNQFYTVGNREIGSKHVFVGTGRIVTKLVKGQENVATPASAVNPGNSNPSGNATGHSNGNNGGGSGGGSAGNGTIVYEKDIYYYHPDHLGSSTFISDADGELYQHLENFPFGETWVEESTNTQRTPYHFTAKELDEETGLYFFGGRYYDPRTSVWQSADPILANYLPTGNKEKDKKLPGMGGVFYSPNLGLYTYVVNNPMKYIDPDGKLFQWAHNLYVKKVKESPDMLGIGKSSNPNKGLWELPTPKCLNFGIQGPGGGFFHEKSPVMQFIAKYIPFMNAISGFHDYMQIALTGKSEKIRDISNIPYMFVAAPLTILAEFGKLEKALFSPIKKLINNIIRLPRKSQQPKSGESATPAR
ncbi:MAG: RHS repeat-associated core domain-containing protein, partial [Candidatus Electrothrix sp.]